MAIVVRLHHRSRDRCPEPARCANVESSTPVRAAEELVMSGEKRSRLDRPNPVPGPLSRETAHENQEPRDCGRGLG